MQHEEDEGKGFSGMNHQRSMVFSRFQTLCSTKFKHRPKPRDKVSPGKDYISRMSVDMKAMIL
jgi:hypothetical protein